MWGSGGPEAAESDEASSSNILFMELRSRSTVGYIVDMQLAKPGGLENLRPKTYFQQ